MIAPPRIRPVPRFAAAAPAPLRVYGFPVSYAPEEALREGVAGFLDGPDPSLVGQFSACGLRRLVLSPRGRDHAGRYRLLVPSGPALAALGLLRGRIAAGAGALFRCMMEEVRERRERLFLVDEAPSGAVERARWIAWRYPGLKIAGAASPGCDFRDSEGELRLVDRINRSGASALLIIGCGDRLLRFPSRHASRLNPRLQAFLCGPSRPVRPSGAGR